MDENAEIKNILSNLKAGEPFAYSRSNDKLIIGIAEDIDKDFREYTIFSCDNYKIIKNVISKFRKSKEKSK